MTIEIYYHVNGEYTIIDGPATLGHAETYHEAAEIEASYLEAKWSAAMGGASIAPPCTNVCVSCGDQLHNDAPALSICDACRIAADRWQPDTTPLLAQCAAFVRAVRDNHRLIDVIPEAARLDAALAKEGW